MSKMCWLLNVKWRDMCANPIEGALLRGSNIFSSLIWKMTILLETLLRRNNPKNIPHHIPDDNSLPQIHHPPTFRPLLTNIYIYIYIYIHPHHQQQKNQKPRVIHEKKKSSHKIWPSPHPASRFSYLYAASERRQRKAAAAAATSPHGRFITHGANIALCARESILPRAFHPFFKFPCTRAFFSLSSDFGTVRRLRARANEWRATRDTAKAFSGWRRMRIYACEWFVFTWMRGIARFCLLECG